MKNASLECERCCAAWLGSSPRYERRSDPSAFDEVLLAESAVDRFIHNAYDLVVEGESYRARLKPSVRGDDPPPSSPVHEDRPAACHARVALAGRSSRPDVRLALELSRRSLSRFIHRCGVSRDP